MINTASITAARPPCRRWPAGGERKFSAVVSLVEVVSPRATNRRRTLRRGRVGGVRVNMVADHIALVLHDFSTGGSERIAIRLANAWAASGRRVTIFCGTEEGPARRLVSPLIAVVPCFPQIRRGWASRLRLGWNLVAFFESHRPDIVFAPGNFHLLILAVAARLTRTHQPRLVCKISNPLVPHAMPGPLGEIIGRALQRVLAPINHLTAMSPRLAKQAQTVLGGRELTCIDEPVLDHLPQTLSWTSLRDPRPLIICIGRLEAQKDFGLALRAFAELAPQSGAQLAILGDGPERNKLLAQAAKLGISDRVTFPGHVRDVADWMARARLLLMTSRYEGFPAVLIEARAAGLPIVTTDCSLALPEIISRAGQGEIVRGRTSAVIAAAIHRQLAAPPVDSAASACDVERFRICNVAPQWLTLFDRLVA